MGTPIDGSRRHKSRSHLTRVDRISQLPVDVMQQIMECMPIEDAVRTSALSKNWRYNWTSISKLVFDANFFAYLESKNSDASIITNILHLLQNPRISCFYLYVQEILSCDLLGDWLLFLSRKGVKNLILVSERFLVPSIERKTLPSHIFSFVELTHLKISGFRFSIPSNFSGFPNLISLELRWIFYDETKSIGDFITCCPFLESLTLALCLPKADHLDIRSRSLKHLTLEYLLYSISIEATALETLFLDAHIFAGESSLGQALCNVPSIKKLSLGALALMGSAPMCLPTTLIVRNITFHLNFEDAKMTLSAFCVLRSSHALEELEFLSLSEKNGIAVEEVSSSLAEDIALSSLRVVKFINFGCSRPELEMIRFILVCSPSLEKIFIKPQLDMSIQEFKQVSEEMLRFIPVSPNAELIYLEKGMTT